MTTTIQQYLQDNILYIGNEIPESLLSDSRNKFIVLGTPKDMIDATLTIMTTKDNGERAWVKEFYDRFTDGADEDNGYYDSMFIEGRPQRIESFIKEVESRAESRLRVRILEEIHSVPNATQNEVQNEDVLCKFDLLNLPSLKDHEQGEV